MLKEEKIRKKVKDLRQFYRDLTTFCVVNAVFILIWLTFENGGPFWPKYVLLVSGITLIFKAYHMNIFPLLLYHFSFLTPEWEEKKVKKLLKKPELQQKVHLSHVRKK
jgi:hypothetical protein